MTTPIPLKKISSPPKPELVEFVEGLLERARSGELVGVLVLEQDRDGVSYTFSGITKRWEKLGLLSHAMHQLQQD